MYSCKDIEGMGGKCNDLSSAKVFRTQAAPVVEVPKPVVEAPKDECRTTLY
jgi:hypothetical protein